MNRWKKTALCIFIGLCATLVMVVGALRVWGSRDTVIQNPIVERLIPLYRSLRKIPDIFFIPYGLFTKSDLKTFHLSIDPKDIEKMNSILSKSPFGVASLTDDRKVWVSASFTYGDYTDKVKVRYRGNGTSHWSSYKKSYLIKFPKDHMFCGMRVLSFIIPSDRLYFGEPLNHYRARKLGLLVPEDHFVTLNVNGIRNGVYFVVEHWSQEWLEKNPVSPNSVIVGVDSENVSTTGSVSAYSEEGYFSWKSWNNPDSSMDFMKAIIEIVRHADDETFKRLVPNIVNLEDYFSRDIMSILAGSYHNSSASVGLASNLILLFDAVEGRLKPLPYNTALHNGGSNFNMTNTRNELRERILSIPEFKARRDEKVREYVASDREDDMAFISQWADSIQKEFISDNAKLMNNFQFLKEVRDLRAMAEKNYDFIESWLEEEVSSVDVSVRDLDLPGSFRYLTDIIRTEDEFIRRYPQFRKTTDGLVLSTGIHAFYETIIVPQGTSLIIEPGAVIKMGNRASFISYRPVIAQGEEGNPIRVQPLYDSTPWGVFAVINTESRPSVFAFVAMRYGSEDLINGIPISGMLAMHNANGEIRDSVITDAQGDDGVNIKIGSVLVSNNRFEGNYSDGIDMDFVNPETVIVNNLFMDNKGDGVDLSWSDIAVRDNVIIRSSDKGVSVGERSNPELTNNIIVDCTIGIAVKDLSHASIIGNTLVSNRTALSAYRKKPIFGGGTAELADNVLWNNGEEVYLDEYSKFEIASMLNEKPHIRSEIGTPSVRALQEYPDLFVF